MKERPIIFSGPMVRAILDGRKTQTRRVVKPQPCDVGWGVNCEVHPYMTGTDWPLAYYERRRGVWNCSEPLKCPYGKPSDVLWVRETWLTYPHPITYKMMREGADTWPMIDGEPISYAADEDGQLLSLGWVKKPSIHMKRKHSRINLEVTDIRLERLQDMSDQDALDEGIVETNDMFEVSFGKCVLKSDGATALDAFRLLWNDINWKKHPWSSNPWVWVVSFKRIKP